MTQERKKRRIVLASVLKPVDDTRMFEKMGRTLEAAGHEVFIIGFPSVSTPISSGVQFLLLPRFGRISLARIVARFRIIGHAWKIKPDIFIFNTHELLWSAIIIKIFMNTQIVYDVRENHYRNILHSESFPWPLRWPLAIAVRLKEKVLAPAIDHFFLAEKGYEQEFKFHRGGWTVLENKSAFPEGTERKPDKEKISLLFSGTLGESTGVFTAIGLSKGLHALNPAVQLHIIGYAALNSARKKILDEAEQNPWITTTGIDKLVPHPVVLDAILQADAGILSYPPSPHTRDSVPTKLFEYLSAGLPILVENNWPWIPRFVQCEPFVFFDPNKMDFHSILDSLVSKKFYREPARDVSWSTEGARMLEVLDKPFDSQTTRSASSGRRSG